MHTQMSICDVLQVMHTRIAQLEHIHTLSYVYSNTEIDDRANVTLADAEEYCSETTGWQSCGTAEDFHTFCMKISDFAKQLNQADRENEIQLTCGVAYVDLRMDRTGNNLCLVVITVRPIAHGHKIFYIILYWILINKPANIPFIITSCGPGSQKALYAMNTKITKKWNDTDGLQSNFLFVERKQGYTIKHTTVSEKYPNLTLTKSDVFLRLFQTNQNEDEETKTVTIEGYNFLFQQDDNETMFETQCRIWLQRAVDLIELYIFLKDSTKCDTQDMNILCIIKQIIFNIENKKFVQLKILETKLIYKDNSETIQFIEKFVQNIDSNKILQFFLRKKSDSKSRQKRKWDSHEDAKMCQNEDAKMCLKTLILVAAAFHTLLKISLIQKKTCLGLKYIVSLFKEPRSCEVIAKCKKYLQTRASYLQTQFDSFEEWCKSEFTVYREFDHFRLVLEYKDIKIGIIFADDRNLFKLYVHRSVYLPFHKQGECGYWYNTQDAKEMILMCKRRNADLTFQEYLYATLPLFNAFHNFKYSAILPDDPYFDKYHFEIENSQKRDCSVLVRQNENQCFSALAIAQNEEKDKCNDKKESDIVLFVNLHLFVSAL